MFTGCVALIATCLIGNDIYKVKYCFLEVFEAHLNLEEVVLILDQNPVHL